MNAVCTLLKNSKRCLKGLCRSDENFLRSACKDCMWLVRKDYFKHQIFKNLSLRRVKPGLIVLLWQHLLSCKAVIDSIKSLVPHYQPNKFHTPQLGKQSCSELGPPPTLHLLLNPKPLTTPTRLDSTRLLSGLQ